MAKLKKSMKSNRSHKSHQLFNTQSDLDYEEPKIAEIFCMDEMASNLTELESLKQQHVSIKFKYNNETCTVMGYLLGTDRTNELAKLATALLNHKLMYQNYTVDLKYITDIAHRVFQ